MNRSLSELCVFEQLKPNYIFHVIVLQLCSLEVSQRRASVVQRNYFYHKLTIVNKPCIPQPHII